MTVYAVSYDLKKPGRNYQPLWDRLAQWKAVRVLESFWVIDTNPSSAAALRDDLKQHVASTTGCLSLVSRPILRGQVLYGACLLSTC